MFLFIFLQLFNYSISDLEGLYLKSHNFNSDSISKYHSYKDFKNLRQLLSRSKPYQFNSVSFILWDKLKTSSKKEIENYPNYVDSLMVSYKKIDATIINKYFTVLNKVNRNKLTFSVLKKKIDESLLNQNEALCRELLYTLLRKNYANPKNYNDFILALNECYKYDKNLKNTYNMYSNHFMLYYSLRHGFFYDYIVSFLKQLLDSHLSTIYNVDDARDYTFMYKLLLFEIYNLLDRSEESKLIYDNIKNGLPISYRVEADLIFSNDTLPLYRFNEISNLTHKNRVLNRNEIIKFENALTKRDTNGIESSLFTFNKKYDPYLKLTRFSFFENDSVKNYLSICKKNFSMDFKDRLTSNKINSSVPFSRYVEFHLFKMMQKNVVKGVNDYLYFQGYKKYFKMIQTKLGKNKKYLTNLKTKKNTLKKIDISNQLGQYSNLIKLDIEEMQLVKSKVTNTNYIQQLSSRELQKKIKPNQTIILYIDGFGKKINVQITSDSIQVFDVDSTHSYLKDLKEKHIILLSNSNVPKEGLDKLFVEKFNKIPLISYVFDLHDIEKMNDVNLNTISFWGTDKAFKINKKRFSELSFIEKEKTLIKSTSLTYNENKLTSDILHYSSHFIESENHPLFNKVAYNQDDTVAFFAGYDLIDKQLSNQLTILNSCESNQHINYDNFSGEKSFVSFFLDAGSKTVIATNSEIDDYTSVKLMEQFYKNLLDGTDAVESLRRAKQYIYDNISKDPKYWATTQIYGQNFVAKSSSFTIYMLLFTSLISLYFFFSYKKKK